MRWLKATSITQIFSPSLLAFHTLSHSFSAFHFWLFIPFFFPQYWFHYANLCKSGYFSDFLLNFWSLSNFKHCSFSSFLGMHFILTVGGVWLPRVTLAVCQELCSKIMNIHYLPNCSIIWLTWSHIFMDFATCCGILCHLSIFILLC